jgi:hypothetical protein
LETIPSYDFALTPKMIDGKKMMKKMSSEKWGKNKKSRKSNI